MAIKIIKHKFDEKFQAIKTYILLIIKINIKIIVCETIYYLKYYYFSLIQKKNTQYRENLNLMKHLYLYNLINALTNFK